MCTKPYDVVVVGAGIAGIAAALSARELGARVLLVTSDTLCDGSSFSRNTWGLGMVSESAVPLKRGHQSLSKAIKKMGMGLCTPTLPERLVRDADAALDWWTRQGASVTDAKDPSQREFVPCFDQETRTWHGFVGRASSDTLTRRLYDAGVDIAEHTELLVLSQSSSGQLQGIVTLHKMSVTRFIPVGSVVLATGGLAGLYESHICPSTSANGHLVALEAGARIVNAEFQQLMVGYLSPLWGTVFNEKLWRSTSICLDQSTGASACDYAELSEALEAHSWHGPFTFERPSRLVEQLLSEHPRGSVFAKVDADAVGPQAPEFVRTYATWFTQNKGADLRVRHAIALFAHSSNGGVAIDEDGRTGVSGLYAAGEIAGGVHGADRIGGLASMSALVFGMRAGRAAASVQASAQHGSAVQPPMRLLDDDVVIDYRGRAAAILDQVALAPRNHSDLAAGRAALEDLREDLARHSGPIDDPLSCTGSQAHSLGAWRASHAALTMS
ncbi:MAG: FAD-dependent oxidoreductase, partial [Atopobiaceae bacterium]|nr:FAD-dependent oxidoreductase [Atopobiaceae bacterium]